MRRRQATAVRLLFTWRENILAYASSIIIAWKGGNWFIKEESGVGAKGRLLLYFMVIFNFASLDFEQRFNNILIIKIAL